MKKAIFAGSFDPFHKGHLSILKKALKIFDYIFLVVANNDFKKKQTPLDERVKKIREILKLKNVKVIPLENNELLANFAKRQGIKFLVRSFRNAKDFKYELDQAILNKKLNEDIETILITPSEEKLKYSSSSFKKLEKKIRKD